MIGLHILYLHSIYLTFMLIYDILAMYSTIHFRYGSNGSLSLKSTFKTHFFTGENQQKHPTPAGIRAKKDRMITNQKPDRTMTFAPRKKSHRAAQQEIPDSIKNCPMFQVGDRVTWTQEALNKKIASTVRSKPGDQFSVTAFWGLPPSSWIESGHRQEIALVRVEEGKNLYYDQQRQLWLPMTTFSESETQSVLLSGKWFKKC